LLVLPYTILPEALNCLFVSPYMKMLRHYLIWCGFHLRVLLCPCQDNAGTPCPGSQLVGLWTRNGGGRV
jgi:hypothetical protein